MISQLFGCILGLLIAELLNDKTLGPLVPNPDFKSQSRLLLSEIVGTFILIFFTLQVSNPNTTFIET